MKWVPAHNNPCFCAHVCVEPWKVAYNLGHSYEALGDLPNARRVYDFALAVNPKAVPCLVKAAYACTVPSSCFVMCTS